MKIKVSKYWWRNLYIMAVLWVIIELVLIYLMIGSIREDKMIVASLMVIYTIICVYAALVPPKVFFMSIEIQENLIKSFLFGGLKCEVFTEREVYYAIFNARESMFTTSKYIAISNEPFHLKKNKRGGNFLGNFDRKKQIILPYNEMTQHLFVIEKWICVN